MILAWLLLCPRPGHSPNSPGRQKEKMCTPDPSVSRTEINNPPGERHLLPLLPAQATATRGESCPGTRKKTIKKLITAHALKPNGPLGLVVLWIGLVAGSQSVESGLATPSTTNYLNIRNSLLL